MHSLADRLRGIVGSDPRAANVSGPEERSAAAVTAASRMDAAESLGGDWYGDAGHAYLVVDRKYSPGHRHGRLAIADAAPPDRGWPQLSLLAGGLPVEGTAVFLDLETTGLAGGAGTYAFLVGLAWFEACAFRVRQFFLASYAAERHVLSALSEVAANSGTVVTYNGKSFDLPVLETRYVMNRMATPFARMPHVDMLHPARRMWREWRESEELGGSGRLSAGQVHQREGGCRLTALEQTLCGHRREGDVPGFEIPARYFHYVRTGDVRPLAAVFEHNRLDLLSLALVTARAATLLDEGAGASTSAREVLGLGQLYERGGFPAQARASFARAASLPADPVTRAESLRALALMCRRSREYVHAAEAWRQLLELRGCPPSIVREATEALAVHHEHRLRDPRSARTFALKSLDLPSTPSRREAVEHRLARLNRKLGDSGPQVAALF